MATAALALLPGHSLGPLALGASLHEVLSTVKEKREVFPIIDVHYSHTEPLHTPIIVSLPENGVRLRFDAADQRLRLIEIMDFRKIKLAYKGSDLTKSQEQDVTTAGPAFRRIYQIFGAAYPGEYMPPKDRISTGTYALSWPGVAFTFPLLHSAWSPKKDHVSLLGSSAASPASHMALFEGSSWPDARPDLFVKIPTTPRLSALTSRPKDNLPAEIEAAIVGDDGRAELLRRSPALPFSIVLNETTPQDLITELGPPDTTYRREEMLGTPESNSHHRRESASRTAAGGRGYSGSQPSSYSSTGTDTFDTDFDSGDADDDLMERASREIFWCYFSHGMDILVAPVNGESARTPISGNPSSRLVVTKLVIHGNVPGSYAFNRHRRLRWQLGLSGPEREDLTSESNFERTVKPNLMHRFADQWPESGMGRGKVVNRTWGTDPGDSSYFLPDAGVAGEDLVEGVGSEQWLGNTKLYAFPGLSFEVLDNGAVSALTMF